MRVLLTPRAVQELGDIGAHIREQNPEAALRVEAAIRAALARLADFPQAGRLWERGPVRQLLDTRYRYKIFYRVEDAGSTVEVLSIRHPARSDKTLNL